MSEPLRIALVGAAGRMGRQIIDIVATTPDLEVGAAIVADDEVGIELVANEIVTAGEAEWVVAKCDVVVDFSTPSGMSDALAVARARRVPFVSGTTGLDTNKQQELRDAATDIPVLWAANFSAGVNVLEHLVELASRALDGFDLEVFEAHHRHKVDAPSGTALFLGEAAARGRGTTLDAVARFTREGAAGPRSADEIGFQVVRGGSIVGEHTVFACGDGERIELTHRAQDRAIFARGALRAARWIASRDPGYHSMRDVLFG